MTSKKLTYLTFAAAAGLSALATNVRPRCPRGNDCRVSQRDRRLAGFRDSGNDVRLAAGEPIFPKP
jgi:hypothetical protein